MSCILCEKLCKTTFFNFNEIATIHSLTSVKQLFQKIIDSSISVENLGNERICGSCYDTFNELDLMEQKIKEIIELMRGRYSKRQKQIIISSADHNEIYSVITVNENNEYFDYDDTELNSVSDASYSPKILPKPENSNDSGRNDTRNMFLNNCIVKKELKNVNEKIHFSDQQDLKNILDMKIKSEEGSGDWEDKIVEDHNVSVLYDMMDEKNVGIFLQPQKHSNLSKTPNNSKKSNKCTKCDLSFDSKQELKSHTALHVEEKPYICEVCGKVYRHKTALDVHVGMHNGIYPFKCLHCEKSFTQKGAMIRHNKIHTGEKPYQCEECGKCFTHHTSFTIHKISHTGEKSYKCNVCGLMLMSTSHLKRHMRVHTGEKRYSCSTCGKRFAEKYNLVSHTKLHNMVGPVSHQKKKLRCDICNAVFYKRLHLEEHVTTAHSAPDDDYVYMLVEEHQKNQKNEKSMLCNSNPKPEVNQEIDDE